MENTKKIEELKNILESGITKDSIKLNNELENIMGIEENFYTLINKLNELESIQENIFSDINVILYNSFIKEIPQAKEIVHNIETMIRYNYDLKNDNFNFLNNVFFLLQDKIEKRKLDIDFIKSLNFKNVKEKEFKKAVIFYLDIKSILDQKENVVKNFLGELKEKIKKEKNENPIFSLIIENDFKIKEIFENSNIENKIEIIEGYLKNNKKTDILKVKSFLFEIESLIKSEKNVSQEIILRYNKIIQDLKMDKLLNLNSQNTSNYEEDTYMNLKMQYNTDKNK